MHCYHFRPADPADLLATTDYGGPLAAVVGRDNLVGTQFHPEKSQAAGLRLIAQLPQLAAMSTHARAMTAGRVAVERLTQYSGTDLDDLCEATESAILEGGGFGWLKPPARQVLENYWKGVLLVPERRLFVGRLDGVIAGSVQLVARAAQQRGAGLRRHAHRHLRRALGARPRHRPRHA